jgi:hypothetical protein
MFGNETIRLKKPTNLYISGLSDNERLFLKSLIDDLIKLNLQIMTTCSTMLSNIGIMSEESDDLVVDCRGHPIGDKLRGESVESQDYNNLIVVGVWLITKENGSMLHALLNWIEFPESDDDATKLVSAEEIFELGQTFLEMMFTFKHRGAIEKSGECFSLFCTKLSTSCNSSLNSFPMRMLE